MSSSQTRAWYPKYVGDYMRDTSHLSMLEHGAYNLLLDHYYATGKPLPANAKQLHCICRAIAEQEQVTVDAIVKMFFKRDGSVFRHARCDKEIARRLEISKKRQNSAKKRKQLQCNCNANAEQLQSNCRAKAYTSTVTYIKEENKEEKKSARDKKEKEEIMALLKSAMCRIYSQEPTIAWGYLEESHLVDVADWITKEQIAGFEKWMDRLTADELKYAPNSIESALGNMRKHQQRIALQSKPQKPRQGIDVAY